MHSSVLSLATTMLAVIALAAAAATPLEVTREMEQLASRHPKQAIEQAQAALAKSGEDRAAQLRAYRQLAMAYDQLDDNAGLRDAAAKGLALARALNDKPAQVELISAEAMSAKYDGRHAEAIKLHDQAISLAQSENLDRALAKVYLSKSYALAGQEHASDAMDLLLKAYSIFDKLGEKLLVATTLSEVGNLLTSDEATPEDLQRALTYHRRGMELIDPKANRYELSTLYYNLGVTYYYLKDYAESRRTLEKVMAVARELSDPSSPAFVSYRLGKIELAEKQPALALPRFEAALPRFKETENIAMEFLTRLGYAEALAGAGKRREGLAELAIGESLAKQLKSARRDAQYHEAAAAVFSNLREYEAAFREMGLLRKAERRVALGAKQRLAAELQARFADKLRDTENRLLRMEQKADEARRLLLLMALGFSVMVAMVLVSYLLRQARQNRRMANLAMRDDLTGLPNRRSILEFARLQFRGRRQGDKGLVLALLDIDHFKAINDQLGHSVGDDVLKAFALACQGVMRSEDRIGRFGGEEFLVVMPGTDIAQIPMVFARLREAVARLKGAGQREERPLTFSMGATEARTTDPDLDSSIKRADEALYRAKNSGRDRVETG